MIPSGQLASLEDRIVVDDNCVTYIRTATAIELALKLVELLFGKELSDKISKPCYAKTICNSIVLCYCYSFIVIIIVLLLLLLFAFVLCSRTQLTYILINVLYILRILIIKCPESETVYFTNS